MYTTKYLNSFDLDDQYALLINGLSGAVDVVSQDDLALIRQPEMLGGNPEKSELVEQLKGRGYLFDSKGDEDKRVDELQKVYEHVVSRSNTRFTFVFNPTYMCNFDCPYCFEDRELHIKKSAMTAAQVDLCFEAMYKLMDERTGGNVESLEGKKTIELFGGEPFLPISAEALAAILPRATDEGFSVKVISNGYSLHKHRELIEQYKDSFHFFQITIDGPARIHNKRRILLGGGSGTFDRIMDNVQMLLDLGINVAARMNVDRENVGTIQELHDYFAGRGWMETGHFYWDLAPVTDHPNTGDVPNIMQEHEIISQVTRDFDTSNNKQMNFQMFRVLRHVMQTLGLTEKKFDPFPSCHYCEANRLQFYCFGPDGLIYACPESIGNPDAAIGRFEPEFEINRDLLPKWERTIFDIAECRECSVAMFCGGGCAYASHRTSGGEKPVCDDAPEVLRTYIESIKDQILEKYCAVPAAA